MTARFAVAVALTAGFHLLALACFAAAIVPWALGDGDPFVSIAGVVLGAWVLAGITPRRERFAPPGVRLTRDSQLQLARLIDEEARACGGRPPDEVYATFEVGASAIEAGRARRGLAIGLPLLHLVSERGLRAVIARELSLHAGGDAPLARWVDRTRARMLRSSGGTGSWARTAVRLPAVWYGRAFVGTTDAIAHGAELAADRVAARRAGRDVYVGVLRTLHASAAAFGTYWEHEVSPILSAGRRPPIGAGFAAFVRAPAVERALARSDSSPAERIAALQDCPAGDPDESPPAAALLQHSAAVERAQAVFLYGVEIGALRPIAWDAVGVEVFLERAQRLVAAHGDLLGRATAGGLDDVVDRLGPIAGALQLREPDLEVEHARDFAGALMADGLLVALHESGWSVEAPPAEPVLCRRGDDRVAPHAVVHGLLDGRLTGAAWRERAEALGIGEITLAFEAARAR